MSYRTIFTPTSKNSDEIYKRFVDSKRESELKKFSFSSWADDKTGQIFFDRALTAEELEELAKHGEVEAVDKTKDKKKLYWCDTQELDIDWLNESFSSELVEKQPSNPDILRSNRLSIAAEQMADIYLKYSGDIGSEELTDTEKMAKDIFQLLEMIDRDEQGAALSQRKPTNAKKASKPKRKPINYVAESHGNLLGCGFGGIHGIR